MGERAQITADDGFTFGAYQAAPDGPAKGAIVVIQEIFGVNSHIREVVDGYAADGYFAIAPQIFDRVERDIELGYEDFGREDGATWIIDAVLWRSIGDDAMDLLVRCGADASAVSATSGSGMISTLAPSGA